MRPNAFTVASRARSTSSSLVTSTGNGLDAPVAPQLGRGLLGKRAVAVPDRDRGAGIEQPLDDGAADALRAAGHHRDPAAEIDPVGHRSACDC